MAISGMMSGPTTEQYTRSMTGDYMYSDTKAPSASAFTSAWPQFVDAHNKVAELQAKVDSGTATPAVQKSLVEAQKRLQAQTEKINGLSSNLQSYVQSKVSAYTSLAANPKASPDALSKAKAAAEYATKLATSTTKSLTGLANAKTPASALAALTSLKDSTAAIQNTFYSAAISSAPNKLAADNLVRQQTVAANEVKLADTKVQAISSGATPQQLATAVSQAKKQNETAVKTVNQELKAATTAERNELLNLESAQRGEITALQSAMKASGASKKEINAAVAAEKKANATEYRQAEKTQNAAGIQSLAQTDANGAKQPITSAAGTYTGDVKTAVDTKINSALELAKKYNIPLLSKTFTEKADITTGVGIKGLIDAFEKQDATTGQFTGKDDVSKLLNNAAKYSGNSYSADELAANNIKVTKQDPNVAYAKNGDAYTYFQKNEAGEYVPMATTRVRVDQDTGLLSGPIGSIIQGAVSLWNPVVGAMLAGVNTAASGGDMLDFLKGVGLSVVGAKFVPGLTDKFLPADIANINGVKQGITQGLSTLAVTNGDLTAALTAGLGAGIGTNVGGKVQVATDSKALATAVDNATEYLIKNPGDFQGALTAGITAGIGNVAGQVKDVVFGSSPNATIEERGKPATGTSVANSEIENQLIAAFEDATGKKFDQWGMPVADASGMIYPGSKQDIEEARQLGIELPQINSKWGVVSDTDSLDSPIKTLEDVEVTAPKYNSSSAVYDALTNSSGGGNPFALAPEAYEALTNAANQLTKAQQQYEANPSATNKTFLDQMKDYFGAMYTAASGIVAKPTDESQEILNKSLYSTIKDLAANSSQIAGVNENGQLVNSSGQVIGDIAVPPGDTTTPPGDTTTPPGDTTTPGNGTGGESTVPGGNGTDTTPGGNGTDGNGTGGDGTGGDGDGGNNNGGGKNTGLNLDLTSPSYLEPDNIGFQKIDIKNEQLTPMLFALSGTNAGGEGAGETPFSPLKLGTSVFGGTQQPTAAPAQAEENPWQYGDYQPQSEKDVWGFAEGGYTDVQGGLDAIHPVGEPEFHSEGGLNNRYVKGRGDGTSDSIPAMLANDEFVIPADVVSALGNGSSEAGAGVLERFMHEIRKHKQSNGPDELPPDSLGPLEYLSAAMSKGKK